MYLGMGVLLRKTDHCPRLCRPAGRMLWGATHRWQGGSGVSMDRGIPGDRGEGEVSRVPPQPGALTSLCPHDPRSLRVALSGCFWLQGAVAQGWAGSGLAGSLQRRQLSRAPPRLSILLSCHCFLQSHMGSTRNNTTVWVQPFKITELFFFLRSPHCSHHWRPDLHVFAAPVFYTSPPAPWVFSWSWDVPSRMSCVFGQRAPFPVTAQTVLSPQALAEKLIYILAGIFWLCRCPVPAAGERAAPRWAGSGPPAPQP